MSDIRISALEPDDYEAPDARRRIGLILLETDHTAEADFARLAAGTGVKLHAHRIAFDNPTTPESLRACGPRLAEAAARLIPGAPFDAVHFCCTSASAVLGDAGVASAIRAGKPGTQVSSPMLAVKTALRALGARRVSVLTPYLPETTRPVVDGLAAAGFEPVSVTCWNIADDRDMGLVTPEAVAREAIAAMDPTADALFVSCTAVQAAAVVEEIEARTGKPVVTSNQAGAWLCLRLAGWQGDRPDGGRLFGLDLPDGVREAA